VHFWRRVATEVAGDAWTEERRHLPSRPELPPDVWISFDVPKGYAADHDPRAEHRGGPWVPRSPAT
jgi:hypothetical protein